MKPKIKIGKPNIHQQTLIIPYEFDYGLSGSLNFPVNTTKEDIIDSLKNWYEQNKPEKMQQATKIISELSNFEII